MDPQTVTPSASTLESQTPATTPVETSQPNVAPSEAFQSDAPAWIREAGLTAAHDAAQPAATPPAQTPPASATPPVQPATGTPPAQTPPAAPSFTPEQIAAAVRAGIEPLVQKPTTPALTDEQVAQQLGVVSVTDATYEAILGVKPSTPAQVKALNDYGQAIAKQAVTIANLITQQQMQQFRDSMTPYIQATREAEASRQRETFFKEHPTLTGYEALVKQVFSTALAEGRKFPDAAQARKYVADTTAALLKSSGITPQARPAGGGGTPQRTQTPQTRPMSPTSMGGRSGGSPGKPASAMEAVWGPKA